MTLHPEEVPRWRPFVRPRDRSVVTISIQIARFVLAQPRWIYDPRLANQIDQPCEHRQGYGLASAFRESLLLSIQSEGRNENRIIFAQRPSLPQMKDKSHNRLTLSR